MRSRASRTCRWSPAAAAMPAISISRTSFTCASCARQGRTERSCRSIRRLRWRCRAWSRSGPMPTSPSFRRSISAPTRTPPASANSASRRWRRPMCATSAIRWRRCSRRSRTSPRTPPSRSRVEIEDLPVVMSASEPPGEFEPGRSSRSDRAAQQLRRHRGRVPQRPCRRRDRPADRPAFRRAAGDPRRHRRLRRRQGFAGAAWRRQNPAPQSRDALPHAQAQPVGAACAREPCRRRLRHPRRAVSRGSAWCWSRRCASAAR